MEFRPCIDIHNGKVKQIVGGSLMDTGDQAQENFVAVKNAAFYAKLYRQHHIQGGHIILLNPQGSAYYEETRAQAMEALFAYPGGLQAGGGINPANAGEFLKAGASHVIVTSYVFQNGRVHYDRLQELVQVVGKKRLVLDLSCRKKGGEYYIVTDRWQQFTEEKIEAPLLDKLAGYADEFLIHAVDVEGKAQGIEQELVSLLGSWAKVPITYAGGIGSYEDLELLRKLGRDRLNFTVGSALDLFGGKLSFEKICSY
ncbi:phosphoribosylformimino-5-aminoimidazole carboxamide ribotide isomerase [Lachnospiraceae bacterium]|nr:phosphoribosylformimino-5-aminoimidazole carboxamide ribotide isomerase [Lachnospiraceae bacterium]